jgi:hypothetical protein
MFGVMIDVREKLLLLLLQYDLGTISLSRPLLSVLIYLALH